MANSYLCYMLYGFSYSFRQSTSKIRLATGWTVRGSNPGGENKFKAQISAVKVMASFFWKSEGIVLVKFLKRGGTIHSEQCVHTIKKLKQRIQRVLPKRKMNHVPILHTVPTEHTPTSISLASWRMHSENAVLRTTTSWNTARVKSSEASKFYATGIPRLPQRCKQRAENGDFVGK
jgi:hypothetical protein